MTDQRILLVVEHGPMQDDFSPEYVRVVSPADAPWDLENIPDGTRLVNYRVVQDLENEIERLKSVPVTFNIPEKEINFGLNCQLEDPSRDEEAGFYAGVSWAQGWLLHTKRAIAPRLHKDGQLTYNGVRQILDLMISQNLVKANTKTNMTLICAHYGDVDKLKSTSFWTDEDLVKLKYPLLESQIYAFIRDNLELFRKPQECL